MKSINSPADVNVSRILRLIWQHKGISRIEIANELGIDKSTVTKIISNLSEIGIISEIAQGSTGPQGGRRPIFLEISKKFACVGGIEINPERFVCCLLDLHGVVLYQFQEKVSPSLYKKLGCVGVFLRAYEKISIEAKKLELPLLGIGVGVPGMVDSKCGEIIQSVSLMIEEPYSFITEISKFVKVPVYLENDARCGCYSEKMLANDSNMQNMLFVLTEYRVVQPKDTSSKNLSVGLGIVINGQMYKGCEGSAGEFRSVMWNGGTGQFLASDSPESELSFDELFQELACHIAFLVNVLNLEIVYIGGMDQSLAKNLMMMISDRIEFQWPYCRPRKYEVRIASLGSFSVSYGAASMVIEDLFSLPNLSYKSGAAPSILESLTNIKNNF